MPLYMVYHVFMQYIDAPDENTAKHTMFDLLDEAIQDPGRDSNVDIQRMSDAVRDVAKAQGRTIVKAIVE